ncbi:hypothetical protein GCM10011375_00440 [Hymenobacter qilianensis]|uniref:Uncharacterized protein n=2 Tax=Hymenobacter qilianensis TaxID=1385715 RepID=A0ACB5PKW5_9BACT|nr:hypothetical protein [Hymenobacter qilianensis]QNP50984.1 hypothetical protein H9L05_12645 [Hymenobacter qilianensis]GGF48866.1 hypothetical protein GCM10011375_00440 [Hymenobacter qilianensis]
MANHPQNTDTTSEDSGSGRVSTTNSGQDGTSINKAFSAAKKADQKEEQQSGQNPKTTSTQGNMGDGAGIRGDYGDSDQTNGMEGEDGADMRRSAEAGGESENSGK